MFILGISAYYHDSAAALIADGEIVAAAQEERFSRKKHDSSFPRAVIEYCLSEGKISLQDVSAITFYDKPLVKFERLLQTYLAFAPKGVKSFRAAMPVWLKEKMFLKSTLRRELAQLSGLKQKELPRLLFQEHHLSHAASAFFPSPFNNAAVLCLDGVGEWATTTAWLGANNKLEPLWEIDFPHSLGMLYSAFTYYTGFKVNSGEYKIMGLAPYGTPKYQDLILTELIDLKEDGTFRLNMKYFNYATGLTMTNHAFDKLFGGPPRTPESLVTQKEMDLSRSVQAVTEEIVLRLTKTIQKETGTDRLCLAGGVALNCVANGRLQREGTFKDIWIQPAAGDAGGALGAALATWFQYYEKPRTVNNRKADAMYGAYLGPQNSGNQVEDFLNKMGAPYHCLSEDDLLSKVAELLAQCQIVGWVQGRMEFGPRALGSRSILGNPQDPKTQTTMNLKIKYRESFRPFAPAVLAEDVSNYFEQETASPYMLLVAPVKEQIRIPMSEEQKKLFGLEQLRIPRSNIPAVTHVDYSARIQTVHRETNTRFHELLSRFKQQTGCSVLVNTSFNVRGEPIVCDHKDAYQCFMRTEMDYLVIENFLIDKREQPRWKEDKGKWQKEFTLD